MGRDRLGTAFHETFALNRPAVSSLLDLSVELQGQFSADIARQRTALGNNYIKAMPRYARACGLLNLDDYRSTPLGQVVSREDSHLNHPVTLWLMHYHLTAPHGPGPLFWHHLVTRCFRIGNEISTSQVAELVSRFVEQHTGRRLAERTAASTATVFLGTYAKLDGLGKLGILTTASGGDRGFYRVLQPNAPSLWTIAYALADYWDGVWSDRVTVNLSDLTQPTGFTSLFLMGSTQLEDVLRDLQREGLLEVHRVAPPYQVVRLWSHKDDLLERLYG